MYRVETDPIESCEEIGRRVRAARAYAGLSVNQLAERLGLGLQTIKRIECAKRTARGFELWAIAEACDLPRGFFEADFDLLSRQASMLTDTLARVEHRLARLERAIEPSMQLQPLQETA